MHAPEDLECTQCGTCCKVFGDSISPTIENVYSWIINDMSDILVHFTACMSDGTSKNCKDLDPMDLADVSSFEIRDPSTGELASSCPFLKRISKNVYICSIHYAKPDMCDNYKPWIWGETYLKRCKTLVRSGQDTHWRE